MKPKEQILTLALPNEMSYSTTIQVAEKHILNAMDEHAKQVAIAFENYKQENKWMKDEKVDLWYKEGAQEPPYTFNEVYSQFISQK